MTLFRIARRHRIAGFVGIESRDWLGLTLVLAILTTLTPPSHADYRFSTLHSQHSGIDVDRGATLAAVSDVNGDGYSDVAIGAPEDSMGEDTEGLVRVYLGSASGLSTTPAWTLQINQSGANFGYSVSGGDVNGDGYGDVLVGAMTYSNGQTQEGGAFLYLGGAGGLNTAPAWSAESGQNLARTGWAVSIVGDVNNDGRADAVVGTPFWNNGLNNDEGKIDVYLGVAGGLAVLPVATRLGGAAQRRFAMVLSPAGDLNADGRADVLVGAPTDNSGPLTSQGRAFVYLGSGTSIAASPVVTLAGGSFDNLGYVAAAGDVNGDGYADYLVGAPNAGVDDKGRVGLYMGGAALASVPFWTVDADSTNNDRIGKALGTAGDFNGDGYADFAIGHSGEPSGTIDTIVYRGGLSIPGSLTTETLIADGSTVPYGDRTGVLTAGDVNGDGYGDLLSAFTVSPFPLCGVMLYHGGGDFLDTGANQSIEPSVASARFGHSLSLGDVNGDGFDDVIVGARLWANGESQEGRALVHLGATTHAAFTPVWKFEPDNVNAHLGDAVDAADVNGDGYLDVVAGAGQFSNGQAGEGKVFVFHGSPAGPSVAPNWSVEGNQVGAVLGTTAASAGDVNGDGYADVIVGAPGYSNGETSEGQVQVFLGGASGLAASPTWAVEMNAASAFLGIAVDGAGDVNADGYSDVIVGAHGLTDNFTSEGRALVFTGGPAGLSMTPFLVANGGATGAALGVAVCGAGDVNGDGFSDVAVGVSGQNNARIFVGGPAGMTLFATTTAIIGGGHGVAAGGDLDADGFSDVVVGAPAYANGQANEGAIQVVYGRASSAGPPLKTTLIQGNIAGHQFGTGLAGAGDVNGDGFADIAIGAPLFTNPESQEGRFLLFDGGMGGNTRLPQQRRVDNTAPIAPLGRSDDSDEFRAALRGRSAEGRATRLRMEWRKAPVRTKLSLVPIQTDGVTHDTGTPGASGSFIDLSKVVGYEYAGSPVHWQARTRSPNPLFPWSRWFSPASSGVDETDLRLGGAWSAVEPPAAPVVPEALALRAGPNPFREAAHVTLALATAADVDVSVFDATGRRVAMIAHGRYEAGPAAWEWGGSDESGRPVTSGVYFVRARAGSSIATTRLVRTR